MRIIRFNLHVERPVLARLGLVFEGEIVLDLKAGYAQYLLERGEPYWRELGALVVPGNVIAFLGGGDAALEILAKVTEWAIRRYAEAPDSAGFYGEPLFAPYAACRLHAPVRAPKVVCVRVTGSGSGSDAVSIDAKPIGAVVGPTRNIIPPRSDAALLCAPGVAIVIGRTCKAVSEDQAESVVAGYTLMTDVMLAETDGIPGLYARSMYESFAPSGPWLALRTPGFDIESEVITGCVNDGAPHGFTVGELAWSVRRSVAYLSTMGLETGDTIWLGRSADAGTPLRLGDLFSTAATTLGSLHNRLDVKQPAN